MFIRIKIKEGARKVDPAQRIELQCDECFIIYETIWTQKLEDKFLQEGKNHFCSIKCTNQSQRTGILKSKKDALFQERYGSNSPFGNKQVQEKSIKTNIERYGFAVPAKADHVRKKSSEKLLIAYHRPETKAKKAKTCLERYGTEMYMSSKHAKDAREKTLKERYGSISPAISQAENRFYNSLCQVFDSANIDRQVRISEKHWCIDFYIKSIDTYIQFDGVFWHALDRSIEEVRLSKLSHDKSIAQAYDRDRLQDQWFPANNKKLVRFTDKEFYAWEKLGTTIDEIKKRLF